MTELWPGGDRSFFSDGHPSARGPAFRHHQPVKAMSPPGSPTGIEAVFLENRDRLMRFFVTRGAGDGAEDLLHDLWLKVSGRMDGPIGNPMAYLFRAADMLMIDRYRAWRQAEQRDRSWSEAQGVGEAAADPSAERAVTARQEAEKVSAALAALNEREAHIFRRSRIDGVPQRRIAEELGISISTVEKDLRAAVRALVELKERLR